MALVYEVALNDARILVHEVQAKGLADLLVYKIASQTPAVDNDGLWYQAPAHGSATSLIHWVNSKRESDLIICYVDSKGASGWRRNHPLKGKL